MLNVTSIVQDDLEPFGDIDNVESFLSQDGGDGNIYGSLKQTLTEHKPETSKGNNLTIGLVKALLCFFFFCKIINLNDSSQVSPLVKLVVYAREIK